MHTSENTLKLTFKTADRGSDRMVALSGRSERLQRSNTMTWAPGSVRTKDGWNCKGLQRTVLNSNDKPTEWAICNESERDAREGRVRMQCLT